jgi:hypothetical protein
MNEGQKVVKYFAIAFAVLLAVGIISGIVSAAFAVASTVSGGKISMHEQNENSIDFTQTFTGVHSLDIDIPTGELRIKTGSEFKVEAEDVSEDFEAKVDDNGKLIISGDKHDSHFLWFSFGDFNGFDSKVTLYLPADFVAEEVILETGAGNVKIEELQTNYFDVSAGAGNLNGSNITADKVNFEGGVGSVNMSNVILQDTDIECGVGSMNINGVLLGDNSIECGVGSVDLNLKGNVDDYDMNIESGVGKVRLNGEKITSEQKNNNDAANSLNIEGGVGNVNISIAE